MDDFGYFRVVSVVPISRPAAVEDNASTLIESFLLACDEGADLVLFPELSLTGYSCGDLFLQSKLLEEARHQALRVIEAGSARSALMVFGMPLAHQGKVFNVALVVRGGKEILGVVPKTYIPDSREYCENRWFASADEASFSELSLGGQLVPFGSHLLFQHENDPRISFAVEICEDLWSPIPPSSYHAIAGAHILLNLSASNELVGKADYRRSLIVQQSARCLAAYVYSSAGPWESTTDMVFGGHALMAENGRLIKESGRFPKKSEMTSACIDLELLDHERRISRSFSASFQREMSGKSYQKIPFGGRLKNQKKRLIPPDLLLNPSPFVPSHPAERKSRCQEIFSIQSTGLATRLAHCALKTAIIGLSGGLDSTLALLVTMASFERLNLSLAGIKSFTLPGFGTSERTQNNVIKLCQILHLSLETIDIRKSCTLQLEELGHSGENKDIVYENVQARYRTALLMNKANMLGGLLVGTGDLSELALGWCTYNGDHMSMYGVNSGVPKTLVQHLIRWVAETKFSGEAKKTLEDILDTPISPELLPTGPDGSIIQKTEEKIGPYILQDFFLYYAIRYGFGPRKVLALAEKNFQDSYEPVEITQWLRLFYQRFFSQQFKRSCLPDGPKVGVISLSPRSDWRMPSDADVSIWIKELDEFSPVNRDKGLAGNSEA